MNSLFLTVVGLALAVGSPRAMQPRVLMGDSSHCDAVMVQNGHIVIEQVCTAMTGGRKEQPVHAEVSWNGQVAVITKSDEKASADWIRSHSLLSRLSTQHHDLYWDGEKVNLGKTDVFDLYAAIPWQGGVLIYGRTIPRRSFWQSWPFKGDFIEARDIEPFCAIYFDPSTLKGEDFWLNGKADRGFFVFPLPN